MITFLLVLIGFLLIIINFKTIKNEKNTFKGTFDDVSSNLKDYDIEIGKLRKEFGETIFELQQEIQDLKGNIDNGKIKIYKESDIDNEYINSDIEDNEEKVEIEQKTYIQNSDEYKLNPQENNVKINEIKEMMDKGLSIDSISEKLGMGKGEILLIEKLYHK
ncbi:hypothetical protein SAMN02745134_00427 [Clostridium acidisoli DSM 12555]|uniref:Uncharacterized protein n=1 Tax=Clostridium acidisoli DSM 12555 TaxID=1121291 RepID=A0A1W1X1Q6_9CLOT|nr:hypothetical protein [Clostridium acidisoli]SMC17773.1 hypothetical protein SAMN02745134_00427 [Clostridium acidisoli DSM 12555]